MRIIFLNSFYGRVGQPYFDFISKESKKTDIFCLNEIHPELFSNLQKILPEFACHYEKGCLDGDVYYGQAIFCRKSIDMKALDRISFNGKGLNEFASATPCELRIGKKTLSILNVHGIAHPGHKLDIPSRIGQSKIIVKFLKKVNTPVIVGGDFNLMPKTRSIKMIEDTGVLNLITKFGIKSTRNKINWDQFPGEEKQYYADYAFVSPDIKVKAFNVPYIEVSDHLPLILDFDLPIRHQPTIHKLP